MVDFSKYNPNKPTVSETKPQKPKRIVSKKIPIDFEGIPVAPMKKQEIPTGYFLVKIPENLNDISISKLRSIYADLFGKEPPHDSEHDKLWIANKINTVLLPNNHNQ